MGVDVSSIGTYNHWSPLADFTSSTLAKISDELPVPNGMIVTRPELHYKAKGDIIIDIKPDSEEVEFLEDFRHTDVCCDECNRQYVLPGRIYRMKLNESVKKQKESDEKRDQ